MLYMIILICFTTRETRNFSTQKIQKDDIPLETKKRRLDEIVKKRIFILLKEMNTIDEQFKILVEGVSKKSDKFFR